MSGQIRVGEIQKDQKTNFCLLTKNLGFIDFTDYWENWEYFVNKTRLPGFPKHFISRKRNWLFPEVLAEFTNDSFPHQEFLFNDHLNRHFLTNGKDHPKEDLRKSD